MTVCFLPPIDCSDVPHKLALVDLQTTNTVLNVREGCNSLIYYEGDKAYTLSVPEGMYNVSGIHEFICNILSRQFAAKFKSVE